MQVCKKRKEILQRFEESTYMSCEKIIEIRKLSDMHYCKQNENYQN
jgi:hypothetical protein